MSTASPGGRQESPYPPQPISHWLSCNNATWKSIAARCSTTRSRFAPGQTRAGGNRCRSCRRSRICRPDGYPLTDHRVTGLARRRAAGVLWLATVGASLVDGGRWHRRTTVQSIARSNSITVFTAIVIIISCKVHQWLVRCQGFRRSLYLGEQVVSKPSTKFYS